MVWTTEIIGDNDDFDLKAKYNTSPFLKGDSRMRKPRIKFEFTDSEKLIWARCATDVVYFAQNYCVLFDTRLQMPAPIVLTDDQITILLQNDRMTVHESAPQRGVSTAYAIMCLHRLLFSMDYFIYTLEPNSGMCKHFKEMVLNYYKRLPFFLKMGVDESSVMRMKFENGSRLITAPATMNAFIGWSPTLFIANSLGHYDGKVCHLVGRSLIPAIAARTTSRLILQNPLENAGYNSPEFNLWMMALRLNPSPHMTHKEFTTPMPNSVGMSGIPMDNVHTQCIKLIKQMMALGNITAQELRQLAKGAS